MSGDLNFVKDLQTVVCRQNKTSRGFCLLWDRNFNSC